MDGAIFNDLEWLSEIFNDMRHRPCSWENITIQRDIDNIIVDVFKIMTCSEPTDSFRLKGQRHCSSTAGAEPGHKVLQPGSCSGCPPPGAATAFDRSYDFLLVGHCKYSCMLYNFQVIWRWIIVTLKRSLKVIQTSRPTIRKLGCGFLFAFHSNYGCILHHFREKARYWSKIVIFSYHLALDPVVFSSLPEKRPTGSSWHLRCRPCA